MIRALIIIFTLISTAFANIANFDHDEQMHKLLKLTNKKEIFQGLLKLKENNKKFKKNLLREKSYKPDLLNYVTVLDGVLKKLPPSLAQMPHCATLVAQLKDDYKSEWSELPAPTFKVWQIIDKVCVK